MNFDNVLFMRVKDNKLMLDMKYSEFITECGSSEKAHQVRRLIESAYAHGEKICKI